MEQPLPLAVATAQLNQAIADYLASYEAAQKTDTVCLGLAASTALVSLRDLERRGWTDGGRKSLRTAIEAVKSIMGIA